MTVDLPPAGLIRRLLAMTYDTLLLTAILFLATVPVVALRGGVAVRHDEYWFAAYLFVVAGAYFCWQWQRAGQTLGMKSWRVMVVSTDGGAISRRQALLRFAASLVSWLAFGLGFLVALWRADRLAWHDRWSGTRLVVLPKFKPRDRLPG